MLQHSLLIGSNVDSMREPTLFPQRRDNFSVCDAKRIVGVSDWCSLDEAVIAPMSQILIYPGWRESRQLIPNKPRMLRQICQGMRLLEIIDTICVHPVNRKQAEICL